jgi:DNA-directed RNA polymerase alpha subunit
MPEERQRKICSNGHTYYKSSDCPTCPTCEKLKEPASGFLALLSNPARNTLLHYGIDTLQKLAGYTEKEILDLHGMGKASMPTLRKALEQEGLAFKNEGFLSDLSAPARRALEKKGITTADGLVSYTEKEILSLHGMGPASMPKLKEALKEKNLHFKKP